VILGTRQTRQSHLEAAVDERLVEIKHEALAADVLG
jgi:hypothetical protein